MRLRLRFPLTASFIASFLLQENNHFLNRYVMAKSRSNKFIDTIDECLTNGVKNGIFQVSLEDNVLNGREVTIGVATFVWTLS
jgi:hypothetical protein